MKQHEYMQQHDTRNDDGYRGEKPAYIDPARLKFLELPTLVNGKREERKRPMLIGGKPEKVYK